MHDPAVLENIRGVRTDIVRKDLYPGVPEWIFHELKAYVLEGQPTGTFLQAVIANDLKDSIGRADDYGVAALQPLVRLLYNGCPGGCWGSRETYVRWLKIGRVVQWVAFRTGYLDGLELSGGVMGYWMLAKAPRVSDFDEVVALVDAPTTEEAADAVGVMFDGAEVYLTREYPADWRPDPMAYPMP